jgi:hypothetical protein
MSRSKPVVTASVLQFLWSGAMTILTLPDLFQGAGSESGGASGYVVTVLAFTCGILGLVSAYGVWKNTRGGKILAIIVNVVLGFLFLGAVVFASAPVKLMAGVLLLIPVVIIVLLLWRDSRGVVEV